MLCAHPASALTYTSVYSFGASSTDGTRPITTPVQNALLSPSDIFGTTDIGGANTSCNGGSGCGTIYAINPMSGAESVLYSFSGIAPIGGGGSHLNSGVILASGNVLIGTTTYGGRKKLGTLFKYDHSTHAYTILHSFTAADGSYPNAVFQDSSGNLWGTSDEGGVNNSGTVWEYTSTGNFSVIYSFGPAYSTDGKNPQAGLAIDSSGNFWGTTINGGTGTSCTVGSTNGCGTIFEVTAAGAYRQIHSFGATVGDAVAPSSPVTFDQSGNLWGVTELGGANNIGAIYELSGTTYSVYHSFSGGSSDGSYPLAPPSVDQNGNLWGTTFSGGSGAYTSNSGTVYEINIQGAYSIVYNFGATSSDGIYPSSGVLIDRDDDVWSTTQRGGSNGAGTLFEIH